MAGYSSMALEGSRKVARWLAGALLAALLGCGGESPESDAEASGSSSVEETSSEFSASAVGRPPQFPAVLTDVHAVVLVGYEDANQDEFGNLWPTQVDLVRSRDENVLELLSELSAWEWFAQREILLDNNPGLEVDSWEVVPGQVLVVVAPDLSQAGVDAVVAAVELDRENLAGLNLRVSREEITLYENVGGFVFASYWNDDMEHRVRLGVGGVLEIRLMREGFEVFGDPSPGFWSRISPF